MPHDDRKKYLPPILDSTINQLDKWSRDNSSVEKTENIVEKVMHGNPKISEAKAAIETVEEEEPLQTYSKLQAKDGKKHFEVTSQATTNTQDPDFAIMRRLRFIVNFPFPGQTDKQKKKE